MKGADRFAGSIGYRDRHHLARVLMADGLPPPEALAGWVQVLRWSMSAEHSPGLSLATLAKQDGRDPAVCARHVRRLTGCTWSEVKLFGPLWVAEQLRAECIARGQANFGAVRSA